MLEYLKLFIDKLICFIKYRNHNYIPYKLSTPYYSVSIYGGGSGIARYDGYFFTVGYKCKCCRDIFQKEYFCEFENMPEVTIEELKQLNTGLYKIRKSKIDTDILKYYPNIKYTYTKKYFIIALCNNI